MSTILGATTPSQSEPGSDGNEGILHISQISETGALASDGLVSCIQDTCWVGSYLPVEMRAVYSTVSADGAEMKFTIKYSCQIQVILKY